ncbi:MAG: protein jag [Chloroflexi bacterium]|nr:protein jag [Chloroflexota bacterium]
MAERSRSIEVSARTVDEAVLKALQQLGLSQDEVTVEVIKPGSRGLLGLGGEDAVVRVTAKELPGTAEEGVSEQPPSAMQEEPMPPAAPQKAQTEGIAAEQETLAQLGSEVLQTLLHYMGLQAKVTQEEAPAEIQAESPTVAFNISGTDLGVLIGRRGETLRDLQYLTCLLISRRTQYWPNVMVDVEHYKSRRQKSLIDLARRMANKVRITAQPVSLEPMPAYERRIIHLALRDDPDVFTESVGQDEKRKVVILPKK